MPEDQLPGNRLPADVVERLFGQLAGAPLPAPSPGAVVARGRQRRRRARIGAAAAVVVVIAAAALGAQQVASLGAGRSQVVSPVGSSPSPTVTRSSAPVLPPAGSGPLILGVDASNRIVMSRLGSTAAPAPVPGLPDVANFFWQIATNPAGGWVVTYPTAAVNADGEQPSRLATVSPSGSVQLFGPAFGRNKNVLSIAVSPDGSRLALAITTESSVRAVSDSSAAITVIAMPGHHADTRTWTFTRGEVNQAKDLSWAPGGQDLAYAAGLQTGAGIDGNPVTLDTATAGQAAPVVTGWPVERTAGRPCHPDAGGWLGDSGRFAAIEECDAAQTIVFQPASESTGTPTGPEITLPGQHPGCVSAMIDSSPDGKQILIGYCDALFLDNDGKLTLLSRSLGGEAAWAGSGISRSPS
jgi:hypothetical protein